MRTPEYAPMATSKFTSLLLYHCYTLTVFTCINTHYYHVIFIDNTAKRVMLHGDTIVWYVGSTEQAYVTDFLVLWE